MNLGQRFEELTDIVKFQKLLIMQQVQSKFSISVKPPLPSTKTLASPRSPKIPLSPSALPIKRTSNNKSIQRVSVQKSRKELQIEKEIKYTKNVKPDVKNEPSQIQSDTNTFAMPINTKLEESLSTVQRLKSNSRQKRQGSYSKRFEILEHTNTKMFDSISAVSHQNHNRKGSAQKNEEFYLYWKNKAHQYLQANMKLMDQVSKLTKENADLKETIQKSQSFSNKITSNNLTLNSSSKAGEGDKYLAELRAMSTHYLKKIQQMERELKRKEVLIISYEIKTKELAQVLVGDRERIAIIAKLKDELLTLKQENIQLKQQAHQKKSIDLQKNNVLKSKHKVNHISNS